jgi:uncharacterized protein (TIGR02757 family)
MNNRLKEAEFRELIQKLAAKYDVESFIEKDPVQFPHRYVKKRDIEISAVLTSWISYGSRTQIIRKAEEMDALFEGDPIGYIQKGLWERFAGSTKTWYRFYKENDYAELCAAFRAVYEQFDSLEEAVIGNRRHLQVSLLKALELPFHGIHGFSDPDQGSACKRLCMLLRWLVRRDGIVDFGIWRNISPCDLIIPVDTHVRQAAADILHITDRKAADMKTAQEITDRMRTIFPEDPTLGDFALFGLGLESVRPLEKEK